ncbi:MAG TPA: hypothetical protein VFO93_03290 [Hymenobacter sp.]|uniref:P-loop ATPase, Sll1717 family n=1 Tax=Hymenobacter sp. TaxID=1898978 RepID=UPI002D7E9A9B|nr:hypothetical protein [Hymenobacter sp.]HET9502540.1 hypothetical protein [Hymenobacter sp.]
MNISQKTSILNNLELGSIIAEQDELLTQCFVTHPVLNEFLLDRKDLILGSKGAGKSALWKEVRDNQNKYHSINNVQLVLATNHTGDPEFREVFKDLSSQAFPTADQLRVAWKIYLIALFFKSAKERLTNDENIIKFEKKLRKHDILYSHPNNLRKLLDFAINKARHFNKVEVKVDSLGVEFNAPDNPNKAANTTTIVIPFNELFTELSSIIELYQFRIWIILDRLDEIVLGDEDRENTILKGLLLAYRDISDHKILRTKIFLRDDVYLRVTDTGHFPALSHINSRASNPISWENSDLLELFVKRLLTNSEIVKIVHVDNNTQINSAQREEIFYKLFPRKIDRGRAADGFKWICDRIADGNLVVTPRDLLSVFAQAKVFQVRQNQRDNVELADSILFSSETIRKAVKATSTSNLETRIYPEYPDLKEKIKLFERGKADHNESSLREILGSDWLNIIKRLERIGFIYKRSKKNTEIWTIPFFYSFALDITRGASFKLD